MSTKQGSLILGVYLCMLALPPARAEVKVIFEHNSEPASEFEFKAIPHPLKNDLAASAKFVIVDGASDPNGSTIQALNDGRLPEEPDQPAKNFFFNAGDDGGRLQLDLGHVSDIKEVNSFSWHVADRAPQVYKLYAADGAAAGFNPAPKRGTAPEQCGWKLLGSVDTRPRDAEFGGQYGVSISDSSGTLGAYRYLLFDVSQTESRDTFGNTFFSEIDVRTAQPAEPEIAAGSDQARPKDFDYAVDTSGAADLKDWAESRLRPAIDRWYPIIRDSLASDGFTAPRNFSISIKDMDGVAGTSDTSVEVSAEWIRSQLRRTQWNEAVGSIIHELVHVVQQYKSSENPGYLVEGIADYLRWFHFEPADRRPKLRNPERARLSDSYKTTAGFLEYVVRNHDHEFVVKLNAAMRQGRYSSGIWKDCTGLSAEQLWSEYVKWVEASIEPPFVLRSADQYCEISIDTSEAPELKDWARKTLAPVLAEWYPKIVAMLPSEGYTAPTNFSVTIAPGNGVAATGRNRITANSTWLKRELNGEAVGALLHEEVHVVQQYRGNRRGNPDYKRPPGWLVEGIPDYIRWFIYEPQSHGADVDFFRTRRNLDLNYDKLYRISANFLHYVFEHYGQGKELLKNVNAACREGKYSDDLWKEMTGKSLQDLNQEWKDAVHKELGQ